MGQWPTSLWAQHLAYARWIVGAGGYVVELVRSDDLDPTKWRLFVDGAQRLGLRPVIRLATFQDRAAGHWTAPLRDADGRYTTIAGRFADFLRLVNPTDQPLYAIVGNEPNRSDEWGGRPDAGEYARYLRDVGEALHRADPRVRVLNAALDLYAPNTGTRDLNGFRAVDAESFLAGMVAADPTAFDVVDVWASHSYPLGPFSAPPSSSAFQIDDLLDDRRTQRSRPPRGLTNRGINAYRWELYRLAALGVQRTLPVLVTETGWRHRDVLQPSGDAARAELPSETVSEFIRQSFGGASSSLSLGYTPWMADPVVAGAVLFALDGHPARWGHTNLAQVQPSGEITGLLAGFASLVKDQRG
ncbi:MAG: hypothetical protein IT307_09150 [Chloroflexi bacterium]|nr:hypothetical protein [Chloroflexota bacterium]